MINFWKNASAVESVLKRTQQCSDVSRLKINVCVCVICSLSPVSWGRSKAVRLHGSFLSITAVECVLNRTVCVRKLRLRTLHLSWTLFNQTPACFVESAQVIAWIQSVSSRTFFSRQNSFVWNQNEWIIEKNHALFEWEKNLIKVFPEECSQIWLPTVSLKSKKNRALYEQKKLSCCLWWKPAVAFNAQHARRGARSLEGLSQRRFPAPNKQRRHLNSLITCPSNHYQDSRDITKNIPIVKCWFSTSSEYKATPATLEMSDSRSIVSQPPVAPPMVSKQIN